MNNVKHIRKKLNMTQTEFGLLMKVSKQAICNYEKGRSDPSVKIAKRAVNSIQQMGVEISINDFYQVEDFKKAS